MVLDFRTSFLDIKKSLYGIVDLGAALTKKQYKKENMIE